MMKEETRQAMEAIKAWYLKNNYTELFWEKALEAHFHTTKRTFEKYMEEFGFKKVVEDWAEEWEEEELEDIDECEFAYRFFEKDGKVFSKEHKEYYIYIG